MPSEHRRDVLAGAAALAGFALVSGEASAQDQAAVANAVEALTKAMLDVDREKLLALTAALLFIQDKNAPRYIQIYENEQ